VSEARVHALLPHTVHVDPNMLGIALKDAYDICDIMSTKAQLTVTDNGTLSIVRKQFNAAPLGLMGFGMTTILLNLVNANILTTNSLSVILPLGIFYGGVAQILAGLFEAKQNKTFSATAFLSYGFFWLSFVGLNLFPTIGLVPPASPEAVGSYLLLWGIFTAGMSYVTLKENKALQTVFFSLTILFFLLAISDFTGFTFIKRIAGYEGLFCGASAIYLALAEIINDAYNREILPLGKTQTAMT
jgi:succinate-acetate transporter protein